ncbi:hypothetical protein MATL_G00153410 [Megalops atlanticus]|uniref:Protein Shroom4 n=1 Tax=Megalops atlanticus TaxID=7932 RepID=A0A9D3PSH8_MEGAT|nr:hypothetical protein MATL_G00153410 [Megalops atlanticus]
METAHHRTDTGFTSREYGSTQRLLPQEVDIMGVLEQRVDDGKGWELLDVFLTGGAPWGFSLKGGLEHQEPLIITKVEEGSSAWASQLQVGDEILSVNDIPLSGYRQEAIGLVKASLKTLSLGIRRRNDSPKRPHSRRSDRITEGRSEAAKTLSAPTSALQSRYDASSSVYDLSSNWDQANLHRVSDQLSSLGSMDGLDHPLTHLSPGGTIMDHFSEGKRDSAYSSFSTSSGTPDHTLSRSNAASTENMLSKLGPWDGRHGQSLGLLQQPAEAGGWESPRAEEQPGSRHSSASAGRSAGPLWHVPPKNKYPQPLPDGSDSRGLCREEQPPAKPHTEDHSSHYRGNAYSTEHRYFTFTPAGRGVQPRDQSQEPWLSQEDHRMCPRTPLLYTVSQDHTSLADQPRGAVRPLYQDLTSLANQPRERLRPLSQDLTSLASQLREPPNPLTGKQLQGSDRFATILRSEIQNRRARLQKSRSAAALTGPDGADENPDASATSTTYKDHLKEAQARVLNDTSFQRRDLQPVPPERLRSQAPASYLPSAPPSSSLQNDITPLPGLSDAPQRNPGHSSSQVTRVGGRKRFSTEKKARSLSVPDRIHQVGVEEAPPHPEAAGSSSHHHTFFESTAKHTFPNAHPSLSHPDQHWPGWREGKPFSGQSGEGWGPARAASTGQLLEDSQGSLSHGDVEAFLEHQRLGTFAEHETTWNIQGRPLEARASGKYHSADSILDPYTGERNRPSYIHGRPHSPPSADSYGQNTPVVERTQDGSHPEYYPTGQESSARVSDWTLGVCGVRDRPAEPPLQPPQGYPVNFLPANQGHPQHHNRPFPQNPEALPPYPADQSRDTEPKQLSTPRKKAPVPSRPRPPKPTPVLSDSLESLSAPGSTPSRWGELPQGARQQEEQEAERRPVLAASPPQAESCSPSLQFAPQRLTDKPPASLHHDAPCSGVESSVEHSSRGKKVPVRIVRQAESCSPPQPDRTHTGPGPCPEPRPPVYQQRAGEEDHACLRELQEALPSQWVGGKVVSRKEDQKREELAKSIVGQDKAPTDILDQSRSRQLSLRSSEKHEEDTLPESDTSVPKAELQEQVKERDSEDELDIDLANKHQLIDSLSRKLQVLREARESLLEDVQENNALGDKVEATLQQVCSSNELDKFRRFVGDLDKVVSLLLSLSGRLARVESALNTPEEGTTPEEKRALMEKRKVLIGQREDAEELKENLDRRERVAYDILASYLSEEHLADYQHFVRMKSALIVERRKLEDKIRLGEEQLKSLMDSLPQEQSMPS